MDHRGAAAHRIVLVLVLVLVLEFVFDDDYEDEDEKSWQQPSPALRAPSPIRLAALSHRRSGWERGGVRAPLDARRSTLDARLSTFIPFARFFPCHA
jgi:hypothetical protein